MNKEEFVKRVMDLVENHINDEKQIERLEEIYDEIIRGKPNGGDKVTVSWGTR